MNLEMRRLFTSKEIPEYLFEQIQGSSWTVEKSQPIRSTTYLYGFYDGEKIVGFLWMEEDQEFNCINVLGLSVDKAYQTGFFLKEMRRVKDILHPGRKFRFTVTHPEVYERLGCKRIETFTLMEW